MEDMQFNAFGSSFIGVLRTTHSVMTRMPCKVARWPAMKRPNTNTSTMPSMHTQTFGSLDASVKELIQAAVNVRQFAYAPYSNFKVGAAFRAKNGHIYTGCNVENAAFSPSCCAERTAICKAVTEGHTKFLSGAVVAYQENIFTSPCGVCRQFILEFADEDIPLYIAKDCNGVHENDPVLCTTIYYLLPGAFKTYK